ncbi:MAG: translation elongation factor 4, partial [Bacteroidales bacterium]|nr:translation elongation factor 4 [Bacteroidales bacterium]
LIVDATQGIQAQTISVLYQAIEHNLEIIPVLNKMDMESAMPDDVKDQIEDLIGCDRDDIIEASGKTGHGVDEILEAIIEKIPAPEGDPEAPLRALIFDSVFNSYRGIFAYFRIMNGSIRKGELVKFVATGKEYYADEVGVLKLGPEPRDVLSAGDVGYIISGIKTSKEVKVGDTITHVNRPTNEIISGFEDVKPMVFAGIYPVDADDYEDLRNSIEKLQLNDASLTFIPESSAALGFGFRCGFLGLLHMEIIQERLEREFNMDVITTVPNVSFNVINTKGELVEVHNPSGLPVSTAIDHIEEPFIIAQVISQAEYVGSIMKLCLDKRGILKNQVYLTSNRVELTFEMPLAEIVFDFYDKLKSISKGYASFDYHPHGYQKADLVKLDILLNGEMVDALSTLIHRDNAYDFGRRMCVKLKELIPRQQYEVAIQAAIGAKVIARETVKAVRKDVTAKCYGGDITRKRKLLEKQKKGKKRMRQVGNIEVPQSAFLAVLKLD